jgi:hypothetical protein
MASAAERRSSACGDSSEPSIIDLRVTLSPGTRVEAGNAAIKNGTLPQIVGGVLEQIKAEAAYFCATDGMRSGYVVFDLKSPADIPSIAEPLFLGLNASVEFLPVMDVADMKAGVAKAMAAV